MLKENDFKVHKGKISTYVFRRVWYWVQILKAIITTNLVYVWINLRETEVILYN
jgi:hypothetical protein